MSKVNYSKYLNNLRFVFFKYHKIKRWECEVSAILPNINLQKRDIYPTVTCIFKHWKCDISFRGKTIFMLWTYELLNVCMQNKCMLKLCKHSLYSLWNVLISNMNGVWSVSKLWTSGERKLNEIAWAVLNNKRLAPTARDQSRHWNARWS